MTPCAASHKNSNGTSLFVFELDKRKAFEVTLLEMIGKIRRARESLI